MIEEINRLPLPVTVRVAPEAGVIQDIQALDGVMQQVLPDLTPHETNRINRHLVELLERIAQKSGHLPKDVIPARGRGEMTHVLNGRLLRREGIWLGLHIDEDVLNIPIGIVSLNRGTRAQLHGMIGGIKSIERKIERKHSKKIGQDPIPKFK